MRKTNPLTVWITMMKKSDITTLHILLHKKRVGTLSLLPGEKIIFTFDPDYIEDPARPVLSLSFKNSQGGLITDFPTTRTRLSPFFSNLLPEGHMRDYLAARAGVKSQREFFLLWVLGLDLPGAIAVAPAEKYPWPSSSDTKHGSQPPKGAFRFSLAGVQLKFSAIMGARGGLTVPAQGNGGAWIVKLPSTRFEQVPENEFSMLTLAKKIGVDVPEIKLVPLKKIIGLPRDIEKIKDRALVISRFDRTPSGPVHMEDFAQIFGVYPENKYKGSYKSIARVIWMEAGEAGVEEFIRRLTFNTLIGNADMHLKNWSLVYPDGKNAKLSPAYDFVSTIAYLDDENMALKYLKTRSRADFSEDLLLDFAAKTGLPKNLVLRTARETIQRFHEVWKMEKKHLPLHVRAIRAIEKNVKGMKLG